MNKKIILETIGLIENEDYGHIKSKEFEDLVYSALCKKFQIKRQVKVLNRGDACFGRIDFVVSYKNKEFAIEVDRKKPRTKSIFKVSHFNNEKGFIMLRSPLNVVEIDNNSL